MWQMWQEAVNSWPIIPFTAVGLMALVAIAGLMAMSYDAGARDSGRATQLGVALISLAIGGCLCIGLWNVTVSIAKLTVHQNTFATSAPMRE